jgi:hypothetical protein
MRYLYDHLDDLPDEIVETLDFIGHTNQAGNLCRSNPYRRHHQLAPLNAATDSEVAVSMWFSQPWFSAHETAACRIQVWYRSCLLSRKFCSCNDKPSNNNVRRIVQRFIFAEMKIRIIKRLSKRREAYKISRAIVLEVLDDSANSIIRSQLAAAGEFRSSSADRGSDVSEANTQGRSIVRSFTRKMAAALTNSVQTQAADEDVLDDNESDGHDEGNGDDEDEEGDGGIASMIKSTVSMPSPPGGGGVGENISKIFGWRSSKAPK